MYTALLMVASAVVLIRTNLLKIWAGLNEEIIPFENDELVYDKKQMYLESQR